MDGHTDKLAIGKPHSLSPMKPLVPFCIHRGTRTARVSVIFLCFAVARSLSYSQLAARSRGPWKLITKIRGAEQNDVCSRQLVSPSSSSLRVSASADGDYATDNNDPLKYELVGMKHRVLQCLGRNDYAEALGVITQMVSFVERNARGDRQQHVNMSVVVDEAIRAYTQRAFANPFPGARRRIRQGMEAVQLQLSASSVLAAPYDTVHRTTLVNALKALTRIITNDGEQSSFLNDGFTAADTSFRILQRLVTGVGIRTNESKSQKLLERDFNMVLNAFSNVGRMDMAHKTVALQERTSDAPPLSPVAYSILLKGYGRLKDMQNVIMTMAHARNNQVEPDTVMLNSLIDAYVNCDAIDMAKDLFHVMSGRSCEGSPKPEHAELLSLHPCPPPNARTYNTVLKGMAKEGSLEEAIALSEEMKTAQLWDDITTNTLVSAAVTAQDFIVAEEILLNFTSTIVQGADAETLRRRQHPNVEAYTELLDGYAKAGMLDKSIATLRLMRKRGVEPSAFTYTSIIGALARAKKIDHAQSFVDFMKSRGMVPKVVTYNAFISGLVADPPVRNSDVENDADAAAEESRYDEYVDQALKILTRMMRTGIRPNSITVSVMVDALGVSCTPPRLGQAKALVSRLEEDGIISIEDRKVGTAMIRACAAGKDLKGALQAFRRIRNPDVIALNAFMDACCRCGQLKFAIDSFEHFFGRNSSGKMVPDVISYSVLISALLKRNNAVAAGWARKFYMEMRTDRQIMPDTALVDIILTAMVKGGRLGIQKKDIKFTLDVLKDAEKLAWEPGQFERRKRAVRAVFVGRMSEAWKENEVLYGMSEDSVESVEDDLFKRKGWNQVDSGFRLWGGINDDTQIMQRKRTQNDKPPGKVVDEFLASKGWNDVNSGFRII